METWNVPSSSVGYKSKRNFLASYFPYDIDNVPGYKAEVILCDLIM